jgi:hypothetical protein
MFEFLPHKWVKPSELKALTESKGLVQKTNVIVCCFKIIILKTFRIDFDNKVVYGCLATTTDIVEHRDK